MGDEVTWEVEISIHAPAKGATDKLNGFARCIQISIHAPAKGATLIGWFVAYVYTISIHAPAKGATSTDNSDKDIFIEFQSTLPRRERHLQEVF